MEYFKLILGLLMIGAYTWFMRSLVKNKRISFVNALFRVETIFGIFVGVILVISSIST